ncbi:hypothetical protein [Paracidovorax cattleyae]|uniref:hypothetical protein n=1 Tax=Paracidovorax cattleyae TaxID=80868 RepID=UPI001E444F8F|nr:hypothetical protein [Paracidovorax cattleyae]
MLTGLYRQLGTQVRVPTLWLYAENDQYWGPDMPRQWFGAFREGGDDAQFIAAPALEGADGHNLLRVGGALLAGSAERLRRENRAAVALTPADTSLPD